MLRQPNVDIAVPAIDTTAHPTIQIAKETGRRSKIVLPNRLQNDIEEADILLSFQYDKLNVRD